MSRLSDAQRRAGQRSAGDLTIATAFGMSYEQLPEATRQPFRRASPVPVADLVGALAAVFQLVGRHARV